MGDPIFILFVGVIIVVGCRLDKRLSNGVDSLSVFITAVVRTAQEALKTIAPMQSLMRITGLMLTMIEAQSFPMV